MQFLKHCDRSPLFLWTEFASQEVGKGTAIQDSDFDLVIFLNKERPPWSNEVKGAFKKALESAKIPNNGSLKMEETPFCIMTEVSTGGDTYGLDVVLASALIAGGPPEKQMSAVRTAMGDYPKNQHAYSGSIAETVAEFFKELSDDTLALIRLAKMWDRGVTFPKDTKIRGRSYMIELVLIHSIKGYQNSSLKECFIRFLQQMQYLNSANIVFTDYYRAADISSDICNKGLPIIMDPINPHNNLGQQFHVYSGANNAHVYRNAAMETLNKIRYGQYPETWFP